MNDNTPLNESLFSKFPSVPAPSYPTPGSGAVGVSKQIEEITAEEFQEALSSSSMDVETDSDSVTGFRSLLLRSRETRHFIDPLALQYRPPSTRLQDLHPSVEGRTPLSSAEDPGKKDLEYLFHFLCPYEVVKGSSCDLHWQCYSPCKTGSEPTKKGEGLYRCHHGGMAHICWDWMKGKCKKGNMHMTAEPSTTSKQISYAVIHVAPTCARLQHWGDCDGQGASLPPTHPLSFVSRAFLASPMKFAPNNGSAPSMLTLPPCGMGHDFLRARDGARAKYALIVRNKAGVFGPLVGTFKVDPHRRTLEYRNGEFVLVESPDERKERKRDEKLRKHLLAREAGSLIRGAKRVRFADQHPGYVGEAYANMLERDVERSRSKALVKEPEALWEEEDRREEEERQTSWWRDLSRGRGGKEKPKVRFNPSTDLWEDQWGREATPTF